MADEPTIIQPVTPTEVPTSRAEERITDLSEKVKLTSQERDAEKTRNEELTRERDFYAGFSDVVATNPAAKDHKEDILAKVKSGYSVEDATYAVLGKAGKLGNPVSQPTMPAGGSATTITPQSGEKPVAEMTQDERRAQLSKDLIWS
jgi:hypothetical protein